MKTNAHRCAVPHCRHMTAHRFLLCSDHWSMVPWGLQQDVKHAYGRMLRAGRAGDALIAHHRAAAAAVAAASDRDIQRQAERLRAGGDLFAAAEADQAEASKTEERHGNIEHGPQRPPAA